MAELSWEKSTAGELVKPARSVRARFALVGFVLMGVVAFMILSGTLNGKMSFLTVNEIKARTDLVGKSVRVTGAVIGSTIRFDSATNNIHFTMAHISLDAAELTNEGGLAKALHLSVTNPTAQKIDVVVRNQPMPDLLQNEAQAILTGKLSSDGVFYAEDLQLKCPSRYDSSIPK